MSRRGTRRETRTGANLARSPRRIWVPALLGLQGACAHREAVSAPPSVDPGARPVLPSPESELYATGAGAPRDPLVAGAAAGLAWDEALSGAAGALAMSNTPPDPARIAWAAYRSGYPYRVRAVLQLEVAGGQWPAALVDQIGAQLAAGEHLGLARARVGANDHWIALIGAPRGAKLVPIPREVPQGSPLALAAEGLARWQLVSPSGLRSEGTLPVHVTLDELGEWWLALDGGDGSAPLVSVPVYAGMAPSAAGPLETPGVVARSSSLAVTEALSLVAMVREDFSSPTLRLDQTLSVLAREPLQAAVEGRWDAAAATSRVGHAGYPAPAAVRCAADTVALCMDELLRDPAGREALLSPERELIGIDAAVEVNRVRLVLLLAGE